MRLLVNRIQRKLIACGDGLNEPEPIILGYADLPFICIENLDKLSELQIQHLAFDVIQTKGRV
jgi:hypothetical protein